MTPSSPNDLQLDALREVANVGAGHAARALSDLTGGDKVAIDIPRAMKVDVDALVELIGGRREKLCAVSVEMTGPITGRLVLVWPEADALKLSQRLLHDESATLGTGAGQSALAEAANIMVSACLSAVGNLTGLTLIPSVPSLWLGSALEVARATLKESLLRLDSGRWVLEARLFSQTLSGQLLLFPDAESVGHLLEQLET